MNRWESLSIPVAAQTFIALLGLAGFVLTSGGACYGGFNWAADDVAEFLTDQTATFDGMWRNTTFGSSGTATFGVQLQGSQLSFTFDLNGGVFGGGDPPSVTLPGTVGPGNVVAEANNHTFYGDIRIDFGFDGTISVSFRNVPAAGIDRLEATGGVNPASMNIALDYTVFFSGGGGTAVGTIEATQTSGMVPQGLFFAQVGNGGGFTSDILLSNGSTETINGVVSFGDDNGDPLAFGTATANGSRFACEGSPTGQAESFIGFSVPALATVTIATDGLGEVKVGSAFIISDGTLGGVIRFALPGIGIAGVPSSQPLPAFIVPVRRIAAVTAETGTKQPSGAPLPINTGVALRNATNALVDITLSLRQGESEVASTVLEDFPANGHLARFIDELFPNVDTNNFVGSLVVRVADGMVAGTALELGPNPGQFTTLTVTPIM